MRELLTVSDFAGQLNRTFRVRRDDGGEFELELIEAERLSGGPRPVAEGAERDPFSLIFRGTSAVLPQGTYRFEHPILGPLDIFLVPIGRRGDPLGLHYEAVFN